jgi:hypothetical protein
VTALPTPDPEDVWGAQLNAAIAELVAARGAKPVRASTGLVVTTATIDIGPGWTVLPAAYRVTVAAAAGDMLTLYWLAISTQNNGDVECDVASIVSGSPARYLSSGTAVQAANGHGGLYGGSGATGFNLWRPPPVQWLVAAGDVSAGTVTLSYVGRTTGAVRTVGAAAYPSQVDVVSSGPVV